MKTKTGLMGPMVILCGCGESAHERALEQRMSDLEREVSNNRADALENETELYHLCATNSENLSSFIEADSNWGTNVSAHVQGLEDWRAICQAQGSVSAYPPAPTN